MIYGTVCYVCQNIDRDKDNFYFLDYVIEDRDKRLHPYCDRYANLDTARDGLSALNHFNATKQELTLSDKPFDRNVIY